MDDKLFPENAIGKLAGEFPEYVRLHLSDYQKRFLVQFLDSMVVEIGEDDTLNPEITLMQAYGLIDDVDDDVRIKRLTPFGHRILFLLHRYAHCPKPSVSI